VTRNLIHNTRSAAQELNPENLSYEVHYITYAHQSGVKISYPSKPIYKCPGLTESQTCNSREEHLSSRTVVWCCPNDGRLHFVLVVTMRYSSALWQTFRVRCFLPRTDPGTRCKISRLEEKPSEYVTRNRNWNRYVEYAY